MDFLQECRNALNNLRVDPSKIDLAIEDLREISNLHDSPANYWECVGTGAFKECYFVGNAAVKFALPSNMTKTNEERVYDIAVAQGIKEIFAQSFFVSLADVSILPFFIEEEDGSDEFIYDPIEKTWVENPNFKPTTFDTIIIQEKVASILINSPDRDYLVFTAKEYEENPLYDKNKEIIPLDVAHDLGSICSYTEWLQAGINFYGLDFMLKVAKLCEDYGVFDLHAANIGYRADGSPVIFDFLS